MRGNKYNLILSSMYGIVHALVDCACAISIFSGIRACYSVREFAFWVVMYNIIAFVLQPIIGIYADKYGKYRLLTAAGCMLVIIGSCITFTGWISIVIFAFGNALFHIAAGAICLTMDKRRTAFAGIFVAPGDIGLAVGTLIGTNHVITPTILFYLSISFLGLIILINIIENKSKRLSKPEFVNNTELNGKFIRLAIMFLCVVITIRAFIGSAIGFSWVNNACLTIALSIFISAGKAAGGLFADKIGRKFIGVAALLTSAPLLAFFHNNVFISLAGIFLFNMTMPLTMTAIFDKMPEYPAFSFGVSAMALIPGFYLGSAIQIKRIELFSVIILAAVVLYYALVLSERGGLKDE